MVKIIIKEMPEIFDYISSRKLDKQYKKAKNFLSEWFLNIVEFKLRQPKKLEVYQFRINKKYRAFWVFRETETYGKIFLVIEISDHQDF